MYTKEKREKYGIISFSELNHEGIIKNYEKVYRMTTNEFRRWYEENDFEGNADHKMWYMLTEDNLNNK